MVSVMANYIEEEWKDNWRAVGILSYYIVCKHLKSMWVCYVCISEIDLSNLSKQ